MKETKALTWLRTQQYNSEIDELKLWVSIHASLTDSSRPSLVVFSQSALHLCLSQIHRRTLSKAPREQPKELEAKKQIRITSNRSTDPTYGWEIITDPCTNWFMASDCPERCNEWMMTVTWSEAIISSLGFTYYRWNKSDYQPVCVCQPPAAKPVTTQ